MAVKTIARTTVHQVIRLTTMGMKKIKKENADSVNKVNCRYTLSRRSSRNSLATSNTTSKTKKTAVCVMDTL